jgi:NAD+ kinase
MKSKFKTIGLWGQLNASNVAGPAADIGTHLGKLGIDVLLQEQAGIPDTLAAIPRLPEAELASKADLIVAIGGDGTLLHAARAAASDTVALLGVNLGRLGFLTDVRPEHMLEIIDAILAGDYIEETRIMLEARLEGPEHSGRSLLALNDVTTKVGNPAHMQDFLTWVDGDYVNTHGGDGLIVATATGSTAYALSCGGPIIQPTVAALVIVPICPHTLSDRPLVIPATSRVEVRAQTRFGDTAEVNCDGEALGDLGTEDKLTIVLAKDTVRLLHPQGYDYYELLRSKLSWGHSERSARRPDGR